MKKTKRPDTPPPLQTNHYEKFLKDVAKVITPIPEHAELKASITRSKKMDDVRSFGK